MSQGIVGGLIVAAALIFAVYRQTRERRVTPLGMWLAPAAFLVLTVMIAAVDGLTSALTGLALAAAVAAGIPLGWYQGTHCSVQIDRGAHSIVYKNNPIGIAIFLGALGFRFGTKMATGSLAAPHALSGTSALVSTLALGLAVGMVLGLRVYLQRRYNDAPSPVA